MVISTPETGPATDEPKVEVGGQLRESEPPDPKKQLESYLEQEVDKLRAALPYTENEKDTHASMENAMLAAKKRLENVKMGKFFDEVVVAGEKEESAYDAIKSQLRTMELENDNFKSTEEYRNHKQRMTEFIKYIEPFKLKPENAAERKPEDSSKKESAPLPSDEQIKRLREELLGKKSYVAPSMQESPAVKEPPKAEQDLSLAKKHLEDLYGSATVGANAPEKFYSEEIVGAKAPEKFYSTEIADKSIPVSEKPFVTPPITAEKPEKHFEEKKVITEIEVESAKNELVELVRNVEGIRDKEAAKPVYEKIREKFEVATGNSLKDKASERAKIEAQKEGLKITTKKEFLTEARIKQTEEKVKQREWSLVIRGRWEDLSDKEKEKYFENKEQYSKNPDYKNNPAVIDAARLKFATELEAKREELEKKGISLPKEAFYQMMRQGFKPEAIKKRGFFKRLFLGGSIEIPPLDKKDRRGSLVLSKKDYAEMITKTKENVDKAAKERALDELEAKVKEGRKRWINKRQRHAGEILKETVKAYEGKKMEKKEPEEEEAKSGEPNAEIEEKIVETESPEKVEAMMREEVEASVEKKSKKWIDEIIREIISKTGGKKKKTQKLGGRSNKLAPEKSLNPKGPERRIKKGKKLKRLITKSLYERIRKEAAT